MAKLDMKFYDYTRVTKAPILTNWDDIEEGKTYHIPPTIIYDRRDFFCEHKDGSAMTGKVREDGETIWKNSKLFRNELSVRFLVELKSIV